MPGPKVVAAVDLHKLSHLVATRALEYASSTGGDVIFVCVAEPNIAGVKLPEDVEAADITGTSLAKVQQFAIKAIADFEKTHPGVRIPAFTSHTDTGDPAEKIVRAAADADADVIFIATHGRTGLKRLLLGSVAEKVVRLAGCAVQVVRDKHHVVSDD
ncbi:MAG TPA: universal stress protein [Polyangiaceae bacterium]|nr:universal stress protein [Polyangiaceae bacterium]